MTSTQTDVTVTLKTKTLTEIVHKCFVEGFALAKWAYENPDMVAGEQELKDEANKKANALAIEVITMIDREKKEPGLIS